MGYEQHYSRPSASVWTGRADREEDIRLYQRVNCVDLHSEWRMYETQVALLGFCCDEGVRRNKGRLGAVHGPRALRNALASFAWHFGTDLGLMDVGDLKCIDQDLEAAQQALAQALAQILDKRAFPFVLGGGHETAWGSYLGLRQALGAEARIGIINIDAHFDLRIAADGPNSGTPFWQMADWCASNEANFDYLCLGISSSGNTSSLFKRARSLGAEFLTNDELSQWSEQAVLTKIRDFIDQQEHLYLTIDLDAFDAAFAPGVSAPSAFGLCPRQSHAWLQLIATSGKLRLCDICELNPAYDIDRRTARLGAGLLFRIMTLLHG